MIHNLSNWQHHWIKYFRLFQQSSSFYGTQSAISKKTSFYVAMKDRQMELWCIVIEHLNIKVEFTTLYKDWKQIRTNYCILSQLCLQFPQFELNLLHKIWHSEMLSHRITPCYHFKAQVFAHKKNARVVICSTKFYSSTYYTHHRLRTAA